MLANTTQLRDILIRATDGEIGTVDQLYFDDETWAIRYLAVDTGVWLDGRHVLISPMSIAHTDWPAKRLDVALTKEQVEKSPDINTHLAVSRQHEAAFLAYYEYPYYWGGPYLWGAALYPAGLAIPTTAPKKTPEDSSTSASPGKPSRTLLSTPSQCRLPESMRTGSTFATAGRHIGYKEAGHRLLFPRAAFELGCGWAGRSAARGLHDEP